MKTISKVVYANMTNKDLSFIHSHIVAFVVDGIDLPEELADLIEIKIVEVADGIRGIVNWA